MCGSYILLFEFNLLQALEALECGHSFHVECLNNYHETTGLTRANGCPLFCHRHRQNAHHAEAEPDEWIVTDSANQDEPPPVDDDDDDGEAADFAAQVESMLV